MKKPTAPQLSILHALHKGASLTVTPVTFAGVTTITNPLLNNEKINHNIVLSLLKRGLLLERDTQIVLSDKAQLYIECGFY